MLLLGLLGLQVETECLWSVLGLLLRVERGRGGLQCLRGGEPLLLMRQLLLLRWELQHQPEVHTVCVRVLLGGCKCAG